MKKIIAIAILAGTVWYGFFAYSSTTVVGEIAQGRNAQLAEIMETM